MKKLFMFLFIVLFTIKGQAKTYYGNYTDYQKVDEKIEENDTTQLKIENRYLIFKEDRTEYFYPSYIDIEDKIKTDETKIVKSDWLDEKPETLKDRKITTKNIYEYQEMKKIKAIGIETISEDFSLAEIRIYNKDELVDYDFWYNDHTVDVTKDDNPDTFAYFTKSHKIIIDFKEEIKPEDLKVFLNIYTCNNITAEFQINMHPLDNDKTYFTKRIKDSMNIKDGYNFTYLLTANDFDILEPVYEDKQITEELIEETKFRKVTIKPKYQYEDLYFKYYEVNRTYLDDYFLEPLDGYELDLDSKKEFYYVRTRDKIELKDKLIIDSYDTKLEDFIVSATGFETKITSDINYYKNGEYSINFITPFKTIKEKVIVNINENYLKILQNQNKYLKDLEIENNQLIIKNNQLNANIKEILQNKDEIINDTNDKLIKYKYEIDELKKDGVIIEEEEHNNYNRLIAASSILLGATFMIIFSRKKSTKKND